MLIFDMAQIGNRMLAFRKKCGYTQAEAAENAGLSNRTYADIERGTTNMRVDTLLHICQALHITPNDLLTADVDGVFLKSEDLLSQLEQCTENEKRVVFAILKAYFSAK